MAIHLNGTLSTQQGYTESLYIRIEYIKIKPWVGTIEYNPIVFLSQEDAADSKKSYYQDSLPTEVKLVHSGDMSLEYSSSAYGFDLYSLIQVPLTGSTEPVTINFYTESIISESFDVVDFDENGNEIVAQEWRYTSQSVIYSSSIEYKNPIDMTAAEDPYTFCYNHLKGVLAQSVPSSSIKDI